ncbi:MAG: EAL domain-containing protein [Eubacterium sp.]|nr:EAL domain-containing protein [Eubacterium sp.]
MGDQMFEKPSELFTEKFSGGAFVCSADAGYKLIYANQYLIDLFECDDYADFSEFVKGSYNGIINDTDPKSVLREIKAQIKAADNSSGYVFYNIRTKLGNTRHIVNHVTLVRDDEHGDVYYSYIFLHRFDNLGSDFDVVTGLFKKFKFHKKVTSENRKLCDNDTNEYVIIYLNLINFKYLNLSRGIAEGDKCLKNVSEILRECFADSIISRLADDHFAIFTRYNGVMLSVERASKRINEAYAGKYNIVGKFGIYRFIPNKYLDVESALSLAKFACDYIKNDAKTDIVEYSESIAERMNTSEYVLRKLDEAIDNDWIKVYFQPVVRTLTEKLCGMESLVRWDDPNLGFLQPDRFIGILEKDRRIHKLDAYVVEKVCRILHERIEAKKPIVPVSINFSRLDFIMCDMLEVVEAAVLKYDIPRDYIHIEITESMIASDEELMRNVIERFRRAGYQIWMDDFGSGYSSLNLLKDYQFDMLKLDMRFLTPFTEKAKDIMRATVTMAKNIGIGTLAEGVETKEHLDFLDEIGCGKIQGYYYGKPEEINRMFESLQEKGIGIEERKWRHFYEVASFNVRMTDAPLEILEYDGSTFRTLFMNRAFREQIFSVDYDYDEMDRRLYHSSPSMLRRFREFAEILIVSKKEETFYYTEMGNYLRLTVEIIAENAGHYLIKGSIINLTNDPKANETDRIDSRLRELNVIFDDVLVVNFADDTMKPLLGTLKYSDSSMDNWSIEKKLIAFSENYILPSERKAFLEFTDYGTAGERIKRDDKGYLSAVFRVKSDNGDYEQREIAIAPVDRIGGREFLVCVKPFMADACSIPPEFLRGTDASDKISEYAMLWNNFVWNSSVKFFWKDKERRFKGVSQAFLDFFGIDSPDDIIGKTDEDMHWHIENETYWSDELDVISKGSRVWNSQGQCIVKGVGHTILANKMPIYQNDEIIGLVGYFIDCDEEAERVNGKYTITKLDNVTNLMNAHAMLDYLIDYAIQYNEKNRNYGVILLNSSTHKRIAQTYGSLFADKVLRVIADIIVEEAGQACMVARSRDAVFSVLAYVEDEESFKTLAKKLEIRVNSITSVEGNEVTLRTKTAAVIRTDEGITDENIYTIAMSRVE